MESIISPFLQVRKLRLQKTITQKIFNYPLICARNVLEGKFHTNSQRPMVSETDCWLPLLGVLEKAHILKKKLEYEFALVQRKFEIHSQFLLRYLFSMKMLKIHPAISERI